MAFRSGTVEIAARLSLAAKVRTNLFGKAKPFRTSSGGAVYCPDFVISTAKTCVGPNMFERNTIHFMSGVKVTLGSSV